MANKGAAIGIGLFFLTLLGLGVAAERDERKQALLRRVDKEVKEAKEYLKGVE